MTLYSDENAFLTLAENTGRLTRDLLYDLRYGADEDNLHFEADFVHTAKAAQFNLHQCWDALARVLDRIEGAVFQPPQMQTDLRCFETDELEDACTEFAAAVSALKKDFEPLDWAPGVSVIMPEHIRDVITAISHLAEQLREVHL